MELENIVANTVYIKARDSTHKGKSKKWRQLLRFPHINDCQILESNISLTYKDVVESQPIGKKLFFEFCDTVDEYSIIAELFDDLDILEMAASIAEQKAIANDIKVKYLSPKSHFYLEKRLGTCINYSSTGTLQEYPISKSGTTSSDAEVSTLVSDIVKMVKQCFEIPHETGETTNYSECSKVVQQFLATVVFKAFCPGSIYFKRYLQWKWLELRPVTMRNFRMYRVLGKGGFGEVCACQSKLSGKMYAMKMMEKRRIKKRKGEKMALNEKHMLEKINSRFVVSLAYAFEVKEDLCLVLTLLEGGDLKFHIHHLSQHGLDLAKAVFYAGEIALGLQHLHALRIAYRDLKPENCLLDERGHVRISDLGLAIEIPHGKTVSGRVGTVGYMAPEVIGGRAYTFAPDWFSYGCCVYEMVEGRGPFRKPKERVKREEVERRVREEKEKYTSNKLTPEVEDFCSRLLAKNPHERLGCGPHGSGTNTSEINNHPFFAGINMRRLEAGIIEPPFRPDPKAVYCRDVLDIEQFSAVRGVQLEKNDKDFFDRFNTGAVSIPWQHEMIETSVFDELNVFEFDTTGQELGGPQTGIIEATSEKRLMSDSSLGESGFKTSKGDAGDARTPNKMVSMQKLHVRDNSVISTSASASLSPSTSHSRLHRESPALRTHVGLPIDLDPARRDEYMERGVKKSFLRTIFAMFKRKTREEQQLTTGGTDLASGGVTTTVSLPSRRHGQAQQLDHHHHHHGDYHHRLGASTGGHPASARRSPVLQTSSMQSHTLKLPENQSL